MKVASKDPYGGSTLPQSEKALISGSLLMLGSLVCTENLNPDVVVMKSAKDRV